MFDAAVASAQTARGVAAHLPTPAQLGRGRLVVDGELADDRMTLHAEAASHNDGLADAVVAASRP